MNPPFASREAVMRRAIDLARQGAGFVEPNPMVGAVIVDEELQLVAEGWHKQFGGPHAEVNAIARAGSMARGATLFVTLEPCCHFGKTPPCVDAVIAAGLRKVVIGMQDPFADVAGRGIQRLREANIEVDVGLLGRSAGLAAPFCKLVERNCRTCTKWAMTLDGESPAHRYVAVISNAASPGCTNCRRMDAILVGVRRPCGRSLVDSTPPGAAHRDAHRF